MDITKENNGENNIIQEPVRKLQGSDQGIQGRKTFRQLVQLYEW